MKDITLWDFRELLSDKTIEDIILMLPSKIEEEGYFSVLHIGKVGGSIYTNYTTILTDGKICNHPMFGPPSSFEGKDLKELLIILGCVLLRNNYLSDYKLINETTGTTNKA